MRLWILLVISVLAQAQSLIVGIPSTDVAKKKEFVLAHESQYNRLTSGNYWNSFTFATYGIGKRTELAASVYGVSTPRSNNTSIGIGFKTVLPEVRTRWAEKWELRSAAGFMLPISLEGRGVGYWVYSNASIRIPGARTRLTAGPSFGTSQIFGRRKYSTMVGFEQPLTKRWSVVADWFSGTHDLAAGIFALSWQKDPKTLIIFGCKVANNAGSGKSALMIEVARSFGGKH